MKLLVFSDSHGNTENMARVIETEAPDTVIFLGDGYRDVCAVRTRCPAPEYYIVSGNCDMGTAPLRLCIPLPDGHSIFATHGHEYAVKYDRELMRLRYAALEQGADIALFGHTHCAYIDFDGEMYVMNPGTIGNAQYGKIQIDREGLRVTLELGKDDL